MATVTYFTDKSGAGGDAGLGVFVARQRIDFKKKKTATADVVQLLNIPAGTVIQNVLIKIITAEGATATATVGDGSAAAGWDAAIDLNAAAGTTTIGVAGTDAYVSSLGSGAGNGKEYTAADTIDMTVTGALDTAVIDVIAFGYKTVV